MNHYTIFGGFLHFTPERDGKSQQANPSSLDDDEMFQNPNAVSLISLIFISGAKTNQYKHPPSGPKHSKQHEFSDNVLNRPCWALIIACRIFKRHQ
jgi:hypothetical protein